MNMELLKEAVVTFSKDGKKAYLNIELKEKWLTIEMKVTKKGENQHGSC